MDEGSIFVLSAEDYEERSVHSYIVPIKIRGNHEISLSIHLLIANMSAYPIHYPIVPRVTGRIRCVIPITQGKILIGWFLLFTNGGLKC